MQVEITHEAMRLLTEKKDNTQTYLSLLTTLFVFGMCLLFSNTMLLIYNETYNPYAFIGLIVSAIIDSISLIYIMVLTGRLFKLD